MGESHRGRFTGKWDSAVIIRRGWEGGGRGKHVERNVDFDIRILSSGSLKNRLQYHNS